MLSRSFTCCWARFSRGACQSSLTFSSPTNPRALRLLRSGQSARPPFRRAKGQCGKISVWRRPSCRRSIMSRAVALVSSSFGSSNSSRPLAMAPNRRNHVMADAAAQKCREIEIGDA